MGKSRKKFLKKEKAKIKLKGTKTVLPKGQNLTDTNFKVKKVIIKDQVKVHEAGELLSSRKLNIQELLSRLGHHNVNMRREAVQGLNELFTNYKTDLIKLHLYDLLNNISKLILDPVSIIRRDSNKLLANILSQIHCKQIESFFPAISSYLICGLTHIDQSIREDSIHFLDNFLKFVPNLCAKSSSKLLPVCLDLVSHKNLLNRTLSINLGSSLTSFKWRDRVLSRIRLLLIAILENSRATATEKNDIQEIQNIPNKRKHFLHYLKSHEYILSKLHLNCLDQEDEKLKEFSLENFSDIIIPVLLDIIVEDFPDKEDNVGLSTEVCTIITEEHSNILKCSIDIIQCLSDIISLEENSEEKIKHLSKEHGKGIVSKLINGRFPYAVRTVSQKRNSNVQLTNENNDLSCRLHNLSLCKIVILFGTISDWCYVIPYMKNTLRVIDILNKNECKLLIECISTVCNSSSTQDSQYFLNQVSKAALISKTPVNNEFFNFLSHVALDKKFLHLYNEKNFQSWIGSLPSKLTKSKISSSCLEKIRQISIRNFQQFSESLDVYIESILDNIPRIHVEGMAQEKAQFKIASLLYFVKDWDEELIDSLNKAIENVYWGHSLTSYIQNIINLKMKPVGNMGRKRKLRKK